MKSQLLVLSLTLLALLPQMAQADALKFYNNWFITGDYAVAGTGLKTTGGVGAINMSGVPCTSGVGASARIVACGTAGATPAYPIAAFLYWETIETTATAAATNGIFDGSPIVGTELGSDSASSCWTDAPKQTLRVYRADVLRFLPIDTTSHLRRVNGPHTVQLGGGVTGNIGVLPAGTLGASLVIVYRVTVPGRPVFMPLRSVVLYDGVSTLSKSNRSITQQITGFYQAFGPSDSSPKMTFIAGNGQPAFNTVVRVNNENIGTHLLPGSAGPSWDNQTFNISLKRNDSSYTTSMNAENNATCLSWGAIVSSTSVVDSDNDGLLDVWETGGLHRNTQVSPATFGACNDYPTEPCVNLPAMGARNGVQDIFIQMDWMHGFGDGTGGVDGRGSHSHVPKLDALKMIAAAFARHNIAIHFDVGNNYQGLGLGFIIPGGFAQGGSDLDESTLLCHDTATHTCTYHEPYPVLSFKLGLNSVRDGNHLLTPPIAAHFAQNRKDVFRYVLFAHALAGPFDLTGKPLTPDPASVSGVGDRPGGDVMVTLGLWRSDIPDNDQVGGVLTQAGTLMHELGHNLNLSHGGSSSTPNCMPNYPSVMSYLYQTRGLTDSSGVPQIDYSNGLLARLNENSLSGTPSLGRLQYRVRYYAPLGPGNSVGQAAQRHCDGTLTGGALQIRLEAATLATPDWSNGTFPAGSLPPLDINFDGITGQSFADQADWTSLDLRQTGSRANFGSLSTGSLATDAGSLATDAGSLATDAGSLATDAGSLATDAGSLATDAGSLATDAGSLATDAGDEDYDTHIRSTTDSIPTPQQCAGCGLKAANELNDILLSWTPPDTGGSLTYNIYRCAGTACTPTVPAFKTGWLPPSKLAPTFMDAVNDFVHAGATCPANATCYNTPYTYSVTAVSITGTESPYSNNAGSKVTHLFVVADNQAAVYGSANPVATFKIYGDVAGSLSTALVGCAYAGPARNAGSHAIVCTGPAATSATDGVTYDAAYLSFTPGTLTISKRPITVTAVAGAKIYDGLTTSPVAPQITSGGLAYSDTSAFSETYDNKNVGTTHVMTPAGTVSDGNGGNNYAVTFATVANGVITPRTIAGSFTANDKVYDGTNAATIATLTLTGVVPPDAVTLVAGSATFSDKNVGAGKTVTATGLSLAGADAANYTVNSTATALAGITPAPLTIKADDKTVLADSPTPPFTVTYKTLLGADTPASLTGTLLCTTTRNMASPMGNYPITCSGQTSTNYTIAYVAGTLTVTHR